MEQWKSRAMGSVISVMLAVQLASHLPGVLPVSVVYYETILASLDTDVAQTAQLILSHTEFENTLTQHEKQHFVSIRQLLDKKMTSDSAVSVDDLQAATVSPAALYQLVKHQQDWLPILVGLFHHPLLRHVTGFTQKLKTLMKRVEYDAALTNATASLLALQSLYHVTPESLIDGHLRSAPRHAPLTVEDALTMAEAAEAQFGDSRLSLQWLRAIKSHVTQLETADQSLATKYWGLTARNYQQLCMLSKAAKAYKRLLALQPSSRSAESNLALLEERMRGQMNTSSCADEGTENSRTRHATSHITHTYLPAYFLCANSDAQNVEHRKWLHFPSPALPCHTLTRPHSADEGSGDVRVEVIRHGRHKIFQFHDMAHSDLCQHLIGIGRGAIAEYFHSVENYDISTNKVEMNANHPKLKKFIDKLFNTTFHPNTDPTDILFGVHVFNDAIGVRPPRTFVSNSNSQSVAGYKEIATLVLFLNDVTEGGHVIFPDSGLAVSASKGSVLYWRNDQNSKTAQSCIKCPVLAGTRWLARITVLHRLNHHSSLLY